MAQAVPPANAPSWPEQAAATVASAPVRRQVESPLVLARAASRAVAVAGGRRIYDNSRKALLHLLSSNLSQVLAMGLAILIGLPLPSVPLQIPWIDLAGRENHKAWGRWIHA